MIFKTYILPYLPYKSPFLFVDDILECHEGFIKGTYTFPKDSYFYRGHFKDKPLTPGVLLTECAAQICLACYGIYKLNDLNHIPEIAMTSNTMEYFKISYPEEKLIVTGTELYFRFNKLKMAVEIRNEKDERIAKGEISGMIINSKSNG
jgi:3-hydroxyacyl-[acyl-carrier-protein] dehydratase